MWPAAAEQPWFHERRGPDGKPGIWLSRRNGACIFLGEDNLCAIHGLLGERYKPAFCREFPFHVVRENTHWTAVVRPGCAGLWASRIDGQPVEEQLADLPGLPRAYPLPRFAPGHVQLMPGVGISLDSWYAAEPALMHVLDAPHEEPEATVAQLRDALGRAISRQLPAPDPHAYREAMRTVLRRIRQALAAQEPPADTQDAREVLLQSSLDWLSRAQSRCGAKGWPTSTDGRAYLNLVLRTNVYGKLFHRMGGLPRAMGLFLLDLHLARSVAAPNADGEIEPRAASGVLVPWWNLCSHGAVVEVLRHSGASLTTLYMNVEGA